MYLTPGDAGHMAAHSNEVDPCERLTGVLNTYHLLLQSNQPATVGANQPALFRLSHTLGVALNEIGVRLTQPMCPAALEHIANTLDQVWLGLVNTPLLDQPFHAQIIQLIHNAEIARRSTQQAASQRTECLSARLVNRIQVRQNPATTFYVKRIKQLEMHPGTSFAVTNSITHGTFGKLRLGMIEPGVLVAVKELRLRAKTMRAKTTAVTPSDLLEQEITAMRFAGSRLTPMQKIDYKDKAFLLMPPMLGDMAHIATCIRRVATNPVAANAAIIAVGRSMLLQIACQLTKLHQQGLVHCDLKPNNMLFGADGCIELSDFGSVKQTGSHQSTDGTYFFMPPEDTPRKPIQINPSIDIFSLGMSFLDFLQSERTSDHYNRTGFGRMMGLTTASVIDPYVAHYVIRHMLNPYPAQRPSAAQVALFIKGCTEYNLSPASCSRIAHGFLGQIMQDHYETSARLMQTLRAALPPNPPAQPAQPATTSGTRSLAAASTDVTSFMCHETLSHSYPPSDFEPSPTLIYMPGLVTKSPTIFMTKENQDTLGK
ncbi:MAG: hypothetical protein RIR70_428 [Pseudomonadota bacterium]